mmetsp:Transcript_43671/g.64077  ORF Transcript_43671/g.64077 Transcript_43671/m.64077 type:complete len:80 (-) Transcript_43671:1690-1929(-)
METVMDNIRSLEAKVVLGAGIHNYKLLHGSLLKDAEGEEHRHGSHEKHNDPQQKCGLHKELDVLVADREKADHNCDDVD